MAKIVISDTNRACLTELYAWAKKWQAEIGGCGCCGSPVVTFSDGAEAEYLHVDSKSLSIGEGQFWGRVEIAK